MASSFVAKTLQSTANKGRDPTTTSPRKYSSSTASSSRRHAETAATRRVPISRKDSLSIYDRAGPAQRKSKKLRETSPPVTSSKRNDGLPTTRLSGVIVSPNRSSAVGASYNDEDITPLMSSPPRRASLTKSDVVTSPLRRLSSGRTSLDGVRASTSANFNTRFQESPYLATDLFERTGSLQRKPSFGDHLKSLSRATPELSLSPLVPTLSTSPIVNFLDARGERISSRPLDTDGDNSSKASASPERREIDLESNSSAYNSPRSGQQQRQEKDTSPDAIHREQSTVLEDPLSPHTHYQSSVGTAFESTIYPSGAASGVQLMMNPLYPVVSSPDSSLSAAASPTIDGLTSGLLQNSTAVDAQEAQQLPDEESEDPNSVANQAILKRRSQVVAAVEKAKSRISQLLLERTRKRRNFGKGWYGQIQRWRFERKQKRLKEKVPPFMRLWLWSLRYMERNYGSSIRLAFAFIRWIFLLNAVLSVLWFGLIILPFMISPPSTFKWKVFLRELSRKETWKNIVQGESLEKTFVYYGGYTYQPWEQKGWYRVDYMYAVLIGATFLISFLGVLWRITAKIISSGHISMAFRLYPFSSLVFASWDFHITSLEAASNLQSGIRMRLREMLADDIVKARETRLKERLMSAKRFTALFILWPLVMAGDVAAVVELVTHADVINEKFGSQFAQAGLFSVLNMIMPVFVGILVDMEDFKPATADRVTLSKLFFLRLLNLITLFYRLFMILNRTLATRTGKVPIEACREASTLVADCAEGYTCCKRVNITQWNICTSNDINLCLPACTENRVGGQLLRLITITTLVNAASELIYGFGYVWVYSGKKRQLFVEGMAIELVYVQSLVWVGICFSPLAAVLGFFSNLITWYSMRLALFKTCAPVEKAYSASQTSNLTYGFLLCCLVVSTIPATITVIQKKSGFCGPIHEQISMYTVIGRYVQKAPSALWVALSWVFNPAVLLGVIFFLAFVVVIMESRLVQTREFLSLTRQEMGTQRKEASDRLKRVRQTLMRGSITPRFGPSPRSGSLASSGGLSSPTPTLPGQVEAFRFPIFVCTEHELQPFLTYARKRQILGEDGQTSLESGAAMPLQDQLLSLPSALQGWPSYDKMGQQESQETQGETSSPPEFNQNPYRQSISKTPGSLQLLDRALRQQTQENEKLPIGDDQQLLSPPLLSLPRESNELLPAEGTQPSADDDWQSLGQVLRRLNQTQQQEIQQPKPVNAQSPQSSIQDWHSLGQVLSRLTRVFVEVEQPKDDPQVSEVPLPSKGSCERGQSPEGQTQIVIGPSEEAIVARPSPSVQPTYGPHVSFAPRVSRGSFEDNPSPEARTPIFATQVTCPSEEQLVTQSSSSIPPKDDPQVEVPTHIVPNPVTGPSEDSLLPQPSPSIKPKDDPQGSEVPLPSNGSFERGQSPEGQTQTAIGPSEESLVARVPSAARFSSNAFEDGTSQEVQTHIVPSPATGPSKDSILPQPSPSIKPPQVSAAPRLSSGAVEDNPSPEAQTPIFATQVTGPPEKQLVPQLSASIQLKDGPQVSEAPHLSSGASEDEHPQEAGTHIIPTLVAGTSETHLRPQPSPSVRPENDLRKSEVPRHSSGASEDEHPPEAGTSIIAPLVAGPSEERPLSQPSLSMQSEAAKQRVSLKRRRAKQTKQQQQQRSQSPPQRRGWPNQTSSNSGSKNKGKSRSPGVFSRIARSNFGPSTSATEDEHPPEARTSIMAPLAAGPSKERPLSQPSASMQSEATENRASIKRRRGKQAEQQQQPFETPQRQGRPNQRSSSNSRSKSKGKSRSPGVLSGIAGSMLGPSTSATERGPRSKKRSKSPVVTLSRRERWLARSAKKEQSQIP